jgi:hypothetical protein
MMTVKAIACPAGDCVLFWAIDGGPEMIRLMIDFGADLDLTTPRGWTPLSYARAKGAARARAQPASVGNKGYVAMCGCDMRALCG